MTALFLLWRLCLVAVVVWALAHATSPGMSLLSCVATLALVTDTFRALVEMRRQA